VRGSGLGIDDARELRIAVEDGALTVRRPGREPEVVGSVATVRRVVWLDGDRTAALLGRWRPWRQSSAATDGGAMLVLGSAGLDLAVLVDDFVPWGGEPGERRESSGAVDLARGLGVVLEAARHEDIPPRREAQDALVRPQADADTVVRRALVLTVFAGVLAFLSWPYGGSVLGLVLNLASVATIAPVLALLIRCRRRFDALVRVPPDPDGRRICPLFSSTEPTGATANVPEPSPHLQLGEQDVVLVDSAGMEVWLPGPASGGVTSCVIGETATCWLDARGALLLALTTEQLVPDEPSRRRLTEAAGSVGIEVFADPFHVPAYGAPLDLEHSAADPGAWMTDWERGRIGLMVDVLLPLGSVLQLVGAVAAAYSLPPWGFLALMGSAAWLGVRLWAGWGYRRWRREVRRESRGTR
jgi:hypothetical protein